MIPWIWIVKINSLHLFFLLPIGTYKIRLSFSEIFSTIKSKKKYSKSKRNCCPIEGKNSKLNKIKKKITVKPGEDNQ